MVSQSLERVAWWVRSARALGWRAARPLPAREVLVPNGRWGWSWTPTWGWLVKLGGPAAARAGIRRGAAARPGADSRAAPAGCGTSIAGSPSGAGAAELAGADGASPMALRDLAGLERLGRAGFKPVLLPDAWRRAGTQPAVPAGRTPGRLRLSVSAETAGQLDVEDVKVDVADALEQLGGPGVGQGLGQLVAPGLVFSLQGAELVEGISAHRGGRARRSLGRWKVRTGSPGVVAVPVSLLALGVRHAHEDYSTPLHNGVLDGQLCYGSGWSWSSFWSHCHSSTRLEPGLTPPASWTKPAVDSHIVQVHVPLLSSSSQSGHGFASPFSGAGLPRARKAAAALEASSRSGTAGTRHRVGTHNRNGLGGRTVRKPRSRLAGARQTRARVRRAAAVPAAGAARRSDL